MALAKHTIAEKGEMRHVLQSAQGCLMVKQNDSSITIVASNCHGFTPACKVEGTGTTYGKRAKIQADSPSFIQKYSKCMRGVDRFDENVDRF
jgi:hypothetical protein